MQHKYVIFDTHHAVCFSGSLTHAGIGYCDQYTNPRDWERSEITSAGFFNLAVVDGKIEVHVHGRSDSLELDSKPQDAFLIRIALGIPR